MIASCSEGIGTRAFYDTMARFNSPSEILDTLTIENYQFGDHKAQHWARIADKHEIFYVGELTTEQVSKVFAKKTSLPEAKNMVRISVQKGENVLIDQNGGYACYYL